MPHVKPNVQSANKIHKFNEELKRMSLIPTPTKEILEKIVKSRLNHTAEQQIGFPYFKRGGLFKLFRKVPFGWKDLGRIGWIYDGDGNKIRDCHSLCKTPLSVGKEDNGGLFRYCSNCLIKIN